MHHLDGAHQTVEEAQTPAETHETHPKALSHPAGSSHILPDP